MSLIPIPWEGQLKKITIKIRPIRKNRNRDFIFLRSTIQKFVDYINNFRKLDERKINDLIYKLEKSLLVLQRLKMKILMKKNLKSQ